ncbi:hypothetical protein [Aquicoccus sp. SU-CL01552]|uniref:hypothetical protein n=1 Tax=Aquicoccus sp. SU-CL01552 TaxID=3127656 RepID=UPI0031042570
MDFGLDVERAASVASRAHGDMVGVLVIVGTVAALGFAGRLVFVAYGDRIKEINPFRGFSGWGMIGVSVAVLAGGLLLTGKQRVALIRLKAHLIDPFVVSVLHKDSCDVASGKYCVVVFEEGREIVVNWYDRRVSMFEIANDLDFNPILVSRRPVGRPATGGAFGAVVAQGQGPG